MRSLKSKYYIARCKDLAMGDDMELLSEGLRDFKRTFEVAGWCKIKSRIGLRNVTLKTLNEMKIKIGMYVLLK